MSFLLLHELSNIKSVHNSLLNPAAQSPHKFTILSGEPSLEEFYDQEHQIGCFGHFFSKKAIVTLADRDGKSSIELYSLPVNFLTLFKQDTNFGTSSQIAEPTLGSDITLSKGWLTKQKDILVDGYFFTRDAKNTIKLMSKEDLYQIRGDNQNEQSKVKTKWSCLKLPPVTAYGVLQNQQLDLDYFAAGVIPIKQPLDRDAIDKKFQYALYGGYTLYIFFIVMMVIINLRVRTIYQKSKSGSTSNLT